MRTVIRYLVAIFVLPALLILGVAAPQYGGIVLRGRSGRTYTKDLYHSDVANALVRFDSGSGASSTSETFWTCPEDLLLVDYYIVTGMTDTTKMQLTKDGVQTGDILRFVPHLTTNALRPQLTIPFRRGQKIGALQLA